MYNKELWEGKENLSEFGKFEELALTLQGIGFLKEISAWVQTPFVESKTDQIFSWTTWFSSKI